MQPSPPQRSVSSRKRSEPAKTVSWGNSLQIALDARRVARGVLGAGDRPGKASSSRPISSGEKPTRRHRRDVVEEHAQAVVADALDQLGEVAEQAVVGDALVVEGRQREHAGRAERQRGLREQRTASGSAHAPVPGSSVSAGMPSSTSAPHASTRSAIDSELASPVVPKIPSPWQPASSSRRQCCGEGGTVDERSSRIGVRPAARTPFIRPARGGRCSRSRRAARRTAAGSRGRRPWCRCRRAVAAERLAADHRAGDPAVDVQVADRERSAT